MGKTMAAGQFKAKCLKAMDEVMRTHVSLVVTKRSIPLVEIIPIEKETRPYFGWMKGTIATTGDIITPIDEVWDACH